MSKITVEQFMDNHESPAEMRRHRYVDPRDDVESFVDDNTRFHIVRTSENGRPAQLAKLEAILDSQSYIIERVEAAVEEMEGKARRAKNAEHFEYLNQAEDHEMAARLMRAQLDVIKARFAENFSMLRRLKEEAE